MPVLALATCTRPCENDQQHWPLPCIASSSFNCFVQEREDDGDDTIEHLILGPERPAPVVLSSQKARLAPNLRAGDKQSLLGQNLDKLQTLLALQEQGNKFAALLL